jgi:hypothetical protein
MLGITASTSSPSLHTNRDAFLPITDVSPPVRSFPPSTAPIPNITINISNPSADSGSAYTVTQSAHPLTTSPCSNLTPNPPLQSSCIPKYQGQSMTPAQLARWNCLLTKYGKAHVHKHSWEWVQGDFIPFYIYQPVGRLTDYWTEWTEGIGGFISTRELTEGWGAKWRRNNGGQRTECGRRKKVIDLVTALSTRPNWNVSLALRFLTERYETRYTPRKFCDWLKPDNVQAVLVAAVTFC